MEQQRADRIGRLAFNQVFGIGGVVIAIAVSRSNDLSWGRIAALGVGAVICGALLGQLVMNAVPERWRLPITGTAALATILVTLAVDVTAWPMVVLGFSYGLMVSGLITFVVKER